MQVLVNKKVTTKSVVPFGIPLVSRRYPSSIPMVSRWFLFGSVRYPGGSVFAGWLPNIDFKNSQPL